MTLPAAEDTSAPTGITVQGTGEVQAAPDIAVVTLGIEAYADRVADAREQASIAHNAVLDALNEQGVSGEDVQTTGVTLQPRYDHRDHGSPRIAGYVMSNRVQVTVRDTATVGSVVDAAIEAGGDAARVDGVSFAFSDPASLAAEARRAAVNEARSTAEQLAEAAGATVGAVLSITEIDGGAAPMAKREMLRMAAADTPIEPGTSAVTVRVVVRYAIG